MANQDADAALSPKLEDVLSQLRDRQYAAKLHHVYLAAAKAIHQLSDIDLVKYEETATSGAPDLSLWEEMAPVIRDTVLEVNALLLVVREHFAVHPPDGLGATLARAVDEVGLGTASSAETRKATEASRVIQDVSAQLAQEITSLGQRMRSPEVVSDRWNLISDLQAFRTRFRERIGHLVFATASAFADVQRKEVIPGYLAELKSALLVRATVADLTRVIAARLERVNEAQPEDVRWNAQQLERELDTFGRTPAYRAMRAQDKRTLVTFRHQLGKLAENDRPLKKDLVALLEPMAAYVVGLMQINDQEMLKVNDREVSAACGVRLERAHQLLSRDPTAAAYEVSEAAATAQGLYGRDAQLDAFLRRARKSPLAALRGEQLRDELEKLTSLIAALTLF
jgi:hypothetical protein